MALPREELCAMGTARPSLGGARLRMGRDREQDGSGLCLAGGKAARSRMGITRVTRRMTDRLDIAANRRAAKWTCRELFRRSPLGALTAGLASDPTSILGLTALVAATFRGPDWTGGTYPSHRPDRDSWNLSIEDEAAIGDCVRSIISGMSESARRRPSRKERICAPERTTIGGRTCRSSSARSRSVGVPGYVPTHSSGPMSAWAILPSWAHVRSSFVTSPRA